MERVGLRFAQDVIHRGNFLLCETGKLYRNEGGFFRFDTVGRG